MIPVRAHVGRSLARNRAVSVLALKETPVARTVGRVAGALVGLGLALVRTRLLQPYVGATHPEAASMQN
jgi:hypothetical protein